MPPPIGTHKQDIDTPALLVDLDIMDRNIAEMASCMNGNGVTWRPHSKCHKTPAIVHRQIAAGAIGVTCAKLGEAEVMAAGGVRDILVANPLGTPQKARRLAALRCQADPVAVVDCTEGADLLGAAAVEAGVTIRVIPELDIGMDRVGVDPGEPTLDLARKIDRTKGLSFAGVMGYEGHLLGIPDQEEKKDAIHKALKLLTDTADLVLKDGLPVDIVTAGATGSFRISSAFPGITEIQAGGGTFMDRLYADRFQVAGLEFALTVLTSVSSRRRPGRAVVDAGFKTMSVGHGLPTPIGAEGVEVKSLSAEHGLLNLTGDAQKLKIGDKVEFIPGYSDSTMVLHNELVGIRNDRVEVVWKMEGRGKLQ